MKLSRRGQRLSAKPPLAEYISAHFERLDSMYDPEARPAGYIPLAIAENLLLNHQLLDRIEQIGAAPRRVLGYDSMVGALQFREQLARFLGRTVLGHQPAPEQLAVLAGAGTVLEILFHCLCDEGDGVLVPTPSYAGFWADLETRDELTIVEVPTFSHQQFELSTNHLDQALETARSPIKALLLTSPNNPLGTVYSPEQIRELVEWALDRGIHVVVDEVYALSVFGDRPFVSSAHLVETYGESVHLVWAFSKDFGASGLRCGVLLSENQELIAAVDALAYWGACSGHTQFLLGELISDRDWVDGYVLENKRILESAYRRVTELLDHTGFSFFPAEAGFFLLLDLRDHLGEPTWEAEHAVWKRLLDGANVSLTPGKACRNAEPGLFRLCFAGVPTDHVLVAIRRIAAVLAD